MTIEPFWFDVGRTKWPLEWLLMNTRHFPEAIPDVSALCDVLSDQSRAAMCAALMSGTAWTVGELGHYAGVSRSTATEHVNKLVKVDIAHDIRQGRHRYVTLAGSHVAEVIEALGVLSSDLLPTPQSLNAHRTTKALADARTCYSHLAGRLGVRLCTHFIEQGFIAPDWAVTTDGVNFFHSLGIDGSKRLMAKACLDCTERQFHVGGALGTYVCQQFFARQWITRVKGTRAVKLTPAGTMMLNELGISLD